MNSQNVTVNVLDADTKELIQENFVIFTGTSYPNFRNYVSIKGGTGVLTLIATQYITNEYTIQLDEAQITSFGYNYNSIEGNVITSNVDSVSGVSFYPWVVNIYMRKL